MLSSDTADLFIITYTVCSESVQKLLQQTIVKSFFLSIALKIIYLIVSKLWQKLKRIREK